MTNLTNLKISVVTLTIEGREKHLERCIQFIAQQNYPNYEHIIMGGHGSIGHKKNIAIREATGDIICICDDDDWFAPDYLPTSLQHMIDTNADVTGLNRMYFYAPHVQLWEYIYDGQQPYVCGSGMMFKRTAWERSPFPNLYSGEEIQFLGCAGRCVPHFNKRKMVAMIHSNNTASHLQVGRMAPRDTSLAKGILGKDFDLYGKDITLV